MVPNTYGNSGSTIASIRGGSLSSSATAEAETEASAPVEKFRSDYEPLPYAVPKLSMDFDIRDGETFVSSKLTVIPNPAVAVADAAKTRRSRPEAWA